MRGLGRDLRWERKTREMWKQHLTWRKPLDKMSRSRKIHSFTNLSECLLARYYIKVKGLVKYREYLGHVGYMARGQPCEEGKLFGYLWPGKMRR